MRLSCRHLVIILCMVGYKLKLTRLARLHVIVLVRVLTWIEAWVLAWVVFEVLIHDISSLKKLRSLFSIVGVVLSAHLTLMHLLAVLRWQLLVIWRIVDLSILVLVGLHHKVMLLLLVIVVVLLLLVLKLNLLCLVISVTILDLGRAGLEVLLEFN